MATIREITLETVAVITWEREQLSATKEQREELYQNLFGSMRNATPSEGDLVNATHLLGVEMARAGQKKESIKVKRSEFRRIWENIKHVPDDCSSWKGALTAIRIATVPRSQIIREELNKLAEKMKAMQEQYSELEMELSEINGEYDSEEIEFSDEDGANDRVAFAA